MSTKQNRVSIEKVSETEIVEMIKEIDDLDLISDNESYINDFGIELSVRESDFDTYISLHSTGVKLIHHSDGNMMINRIHKDKRSVYNALSEL